MHDVQPHQSASLPALALQTSLHLKRQTGLSGFCITSAAQIPNSCINCPLLQPQYQNPKKVCPRITTLLQTQTRNSTVANALPMEADVYARIFQCLHSNHRVKLVTSVRTSVEEFSLPLKLPFPIPSDAQVCVTPSSSSIACHTTVVDTQACQKRTESLPVVKTWEFGTPEVSQKDDQQLLVTCFMLADQCRPLWCTKT